MTCRSLGLARSPPSKRFHSTVTNHEGDSSGSSPHSLPAQSDQPLQSDTSGGGGGGTASADTGDTISDVGSVVRLHEGDYFGEASLLARRRTVSRRTNVRGRHRHHRHNPLGHHRGSRLHAHHRRRHLEQHQHQHATPRPEASPPPSDDGEYDADDGEAKSHSGASIGNTSGVSGGGGGGGGDTVAAAASAAASAAPVAAAAATTPTSGARHRRNHSGVGAPSVSEVDASPQSHVDDDDPELVFHTTSSVQSMASTSGTDVDTRGVPWARQRVVASTHVTCLYISREVRAW